MFLMNLAIISFWVKIQEDKEIYKLLLQNILSYKSQLDIFHKYLKRQINSLYTNDWATFFNVSYYVRNKPDIHNKLTNWTHPEKKKYERRKFGKLLG